MEKEQEKKVEKTPEEKNTNTDPIIGIFKGHPVLILGKGINIGSTSDKPAKLTTDFIQGVYVDEVKRIVVVKFYDNSIEKVHCSKEDDFDPAVGAALAISRHIFGSHTKFYKRVLRDKIQYTNKEEPSSYAAYTKWCREHKQRLISEITFKKNKSKYLNRMKVTKGEN